MQKNIFNRFLKTTYVRALRKWSQRIQTALSAVVPLRGKRAVGD